MTVQVCPVRPQKETQLKSWVFFLHPNAAKANRTPYKKVPLEKEPTRPLEF